MKRKSNTQAAVPVMVKDPLDDVRTLSATVVDEHEHMTITVRVDVDTYSATGARNVLAMARAFVERLEERLRSDEGKERRRRRQHQQAWPRWAPPDWIRALPAVVDAPPLSGADGHEIDKADTWPLVTLVPDRELFLEYDAERLVKIALDRHWGVRHLASAWIRCLLEAHPDAAKAFGYGAVERLFERELQKQEQRWSVETADLTPKQRATNDELAAATMRWRLAHQPDVVLQDATRAQVEEEAARQYEEARVALQRTKWLRSIAAQLPEEDSVVSEHLTADEVLQLRQAAKVAGKQLPAVSRRTLGEGDHQESVPVNRRQDLTSTTTPGPEFKTAWNGVQERMGDAPGLSGHRQRTS